MKLFSLIFAIYFSIGACIPMCDFSQLAYIDDLVEHYNEHREEAKAQGQSVTILEFMYVHFISEMEHLHDDNSSHDELPLRSISQSVVLHFTFAPLMPLRADRVPLNHSNFIVRSLIQKDEVDNIFHPPLHLA